MNPEQQPVQFIADSEARYRFLFENSMDGILLTSLDGRIFDANPSACSILRRTREQILASRREDLVDASGPALARLLEERERTGKTHGELTALHLDETIRRRKAGTYVQVALNRFANHRSTGANYRGVSNRPRHHRAQAHGTCSEKIRGKVVEDFPDQPNSHQSDQY
jgi:PAS domain S-box-containing protein